jgi:hydroxyacylglutathione hydrolase
MEVYFCPGHTPGHVIFFSRAHQLAFVGDVLFAGSIGRTDFPRGNHADLVRSIREKLWPLGDDVTFVPGHGPASTFGEERRTNPFVGDGVPA